MKDNKIVNIDKGISIGLTEDELRSFIPTFAGFIELGRMGYKLDMSADELVKDYVEWQIRKFKEEENKPKEGKILHFPKANKNKR